LILRNYYLVNTKWNQSFVHVKFPNYGLYCEVGFQKNTPIPL
jgi:hypothetical protein